MWLYLERVVPLLWVTAQAVWVLPNHNPAPPTYFNVVSSFLSYFFLLAFRSFLEIVVLHVVVVLVCLWEEASPRSSYSAILSPLNQSFFYYYYFLNYYYYFYFTILYWFCHTSTWICHGCTRVPHPEPPSHLPPHTISLGHPSAPAPSFLYPASNLDCRFISYMILYLF